MIYSEDFVWLHFPKCAGTKIENIFSKYYSFDNRIFQDTTDPTVDPLATWHDSILDRETRNSKFHLGERIVICSFRRLPAWLESRYSFEVRRSPRLRHHPELLLEGRFLEPDGFLNHADFYVNKYIPETLLNTNKIRFIRTEYFETDFKHIFGEFLDVKRIPDWEFRKRVNMSRSVVPGRIKNRLIRNQQQVYENCPYWKMVEDIVYR
jgi:hypothetical protein